MIRWTPSHAAVALLCLWLSTACGGPAQPPIATNPGRPESTTPAAAPTAATAAPPPPTPLAPTVPATPPARGAIPLAGPFEEEPSAPRAQAPLTILQINDVYSTVPVNGVGGLARVAALKRQLAQAGRTPWLVIAGDFLSPSVASSVFKGEQMVAALNAAGLDLATLGNHEFDFGVDVLRQRMKEARWQWVISNVVEANGEPFAGASPYVVKTFGGLRVGFIGVVLTSETVSPDRLTGIRLIDPFEATAQYIAVLKRQPVDVIVALPHLTIEEDRRLIERFPEIDVVIGGHEHYPIIMTANRTLLSKAGSDARFVARIDIDRRRGLVERFFELIPITAALPDEPTTAAVIADFENRLGSELDQPVATSTVALDAEELRLRAGETNLGNLFADALRATTGADVAIMNAGSIRGDRLYPAGSITRRTLIAMHPFGNTITKAEMTGRLLLQALTWGVSKLPATAGHFPQVSGLTMAVDLRAPAAERVTRVMVAGAPLDPARTYTVALPDYILGGGDGYSMLPGAARILVTAEAGELVVNALEKYLGGRQNLAPTVTNRITIVR
ncbi:MAG: bifunctional UDP-sugar hydrolase/5'-nucleotidase [Vicinamibacterales bacterium]